MYALKRSAPERDKPRPAACFPRSDEKDTEMINHDTKSGADLPRAAKIARLNDDLRKTGQSGTVMITKSVSKLTGFRPHILAAALAAYDGFDADNNPYGERDFGDLTLFGTDLLWKIDYYDAELRFGSDDPSNPEITRRILTVMTAADW